MNELAPLEKSLGLAFANRALLAQALTHRSFGSPHNERFEFLGDSLLNCIIAIELFQRFGKLNEGELSRLRARLVREQTLHEIAQSLAVGQVLRLGEGESKSGGFRRPSILADAVEAIIAAANERGIPSTRDFNGGDQEGVGYYQLFTKNGWRSSSATDR